MSSAYKHEITGQRYYSCERCGFDYKESETIIEPESGLRVCLEKCYNEPVKVVNERPKD